MPIVAGGSSNPTLQVKTFQDIYLEILYKMKQPTSVAGIIEQAKRYANTALAEVVMGFEYQLPWLERDTVLRLRAPYTTGTVSIAVGSTTLTGTSTLWTTADSYGDNNARPGGKISLGGSDVYTVTAVGGAGTITLNTKYVGDSDLTDSTYTYFEDEYTLASDFLKPIDYRRFTSAYNMPIIGRNEFRRRFPRPNVAGNPTVCTLLDAEFEGNTDEVKKIQVYPYPNNTMLIPYAYITSNLAVSSAGVLQESMVSDNDEPRLPKRYRTLIVLQAIATWYRDKKDDTRSVVASQEFHDGVSRLVNDQRIGTNTTARVTPRVGLYNTNSIYRGGRSRRFSVNNSFDEFRS